MFTLVAAILLTAIFFVFGIKKIITFPETVEMISGKVPLGNAALEKLVTISVIILEIVAPLVIVYSALTGKNRGMARFACLLLAAFTLTVTFLYYFPVTEDNLLMFMLHLAVAGGLLALGRQLTN